MFLSQNYSQSESLMWKVCASLDQIEDFNEHSVCENVSTVALVSMRGVTRVNALTFIWMSTWIKTCLRTQIPDIGAAKQHSENKSDMI